MTADIINFHAYRYTRAIRDIRDEAAELRKLAEDMKACADRLRAGERLDALPCDVEDA